MTFYDTGVHRTLSGFLLATTYGAIFKPFQDILLTFGITKSSCLRLMRKLVLHAIRFAHSIIRLRRRLEWTLSPDYYPP